MSNPTTTKAWQSLQSLAAHTLQLVALFAQDAKRVEKLSRKHQGLYFDFSKSLIDDAIFEQLVQLATESKLDEAKSALFAGEKINTSEDRAALHTLLRDFGGELSGDEAKNHLPLVSKQLHKMGFFAQDLHDRKLIGTTGKPIDTVINIGIGGSYLGPKLCVEALSDIGSADTRVGFLSNADGTELTRFLKTLDLERTIFIVASKTFTTRETLLNAEAVRDLYTTKFGAAAIAKHFVAVTADSSAAAAFGIADDHIFTLWDFVGGRYSLWSAIGLPVMCKIGYEAFIELLSGAHDIDQHFYSTPTDQNIPSILALLSIWYRNFQNLQTQAVIPYSSALRSLPLYLQQLQMESNGKSVRADGQQIKDYQTTGIVWGETGTNWQHSFLQHLLQGTTTTPVDFVGFKQLPTDYPKLHQELLANMVAQSEALMIGKDYEQALHELPVESRRRELIAHSKTMPGNKPSTTLLFDELTPFSLGQLLAIYEHKTFVEGVIYGINSFDQWGVELGKQLASKVANELDSGKIGEHDASTKTQIKMVV